MSLNIIGELCDEICVFRVDVMLKSKTNLHLIYFLFVEYCVRTDERLKYSDQKYIIQFLINND